MSRYYNPEIARFISEDTYRGELNDPLSLNRYVYVNNNPMIYIDPNGYFFEEIWEGTKYVGKRIVGAVHGAGELAFDAVVGVGTVAWNTGEFIGSSIGVAGNYYVHQLGLTSEDTYNYFNDEYMKTFNRTGETLVSLPGNMINGVVDNFKTTFNVDNFVNYLTTDNYNEIKDYSKSAVQTGLTIYGGYKVAQRGINFLKIKLDQTNGININNDVLNSPRIRSANKVDPNHSFNDIIDNYAGTGTQTSLENNATLYQVDGSLNGTLGRFEWIVQDGFTTHRMFVKDGRMNGVPIKK